jgi:enoyl-CoA hydratase
LPWRMIDLPKSPEGPPLLVGRHPHFLTLGLNRPRAINALTGDLIRNLQSALDEAEGNDRITLVVLFGAGDKGFCAGGDLRALAEAVREGAFDRADRFFEQEYALDLRIHRFPKPVMVLADGITMGGGLGLAAGAGLVLVTEKSRLAMPETQIGFFPDVGASRWLFDKCPRGSPELLGLAGYEILGGEGVRIGLATNLIRAGKSEEFRRGLETFSQSLSGDKEEAIRQLKDFLSSFGGNPVPARTRRDEWVAAHFAGKASVKEIISSLSQDRLERSWSAEALQRLEERSPTALALTLRLLRFNEFRDLEEVFSVEARAAHFIIQQPDYLEGIRARLLDKDDQPHWDPPVLDQVPPWDIETL